MTHARRTFRAIAPGQGVALSGPTLAVATPAVQAPLGRLGFFTVAQTARFRAAHRRQGVNAARHGMLIVACAALLNCVWAARTLQENLHITILVNATLIAIAGAIYLLISARPKLRTDGALLAMLISIDLAAVWLASHRGEVGVVAFGDLLLLPVVVGLVLQWPTRVHVGWLAAHTTITLAYALQAASVSTVRGEAVLVMLAASVAVSLIVHVTRLRSRVRGFVQGEKISALNRQVRRDKSDLQRLNLMLDQTARTDELTGLANRLSMRLDLATARARVARHGAHYVLLLADLDHFKAINDQFGHMAGDAALRTVAECLGSSTRPGDGVYRYGGEEFALLVKVAAPADALLVAERVRRRVEALDIAHPANSPHDRMTMSVGATVIGPAELSITDDRLFGCADDALYRAKAAGRNCSRFRAARDGAPKPRKSSSEPWGDEAIQLVMPRRAAAAREGANR